MREGELSRNLPGWLKEHGSEAGARVLRGHTGEEALAPPERETGRRSHFPDPVLSMSCGRFPKRLMPPRAWHKMKIRRECRAVLGAYEPTPSLGLNTLRYCTNLDLTSWFLLADSVVCGKVGTGRRAKNSRISSSAVE
jgi:hypothetical protein